MDADDRALLEEAVEAAIGPHDGLAPTESALDALGWADMLAVESIAAAAVVFGRLGRTNAASGALDDVVAHHLGLPLGDAVIHPAWGRAEPDGRRGTERIVAEGTAGPRLRDAQRARVLLIDGVATIATADIRLDPPRADAALTRIVIDGADVADWHPVPPDAMAAVVTAARHALAHQLNGGAVEMLALARDHAVDRIQFGRPIGSFQAVRHRLAETHVAIESAADALAAADENPAPLAVDLARVLAGRAARDAARHCQQVLAGVGFTREHDFHRHLFTTVELDGLYGTTPALTRALGHRLLLERAVPRVVDL